MKKLLLFGLLAALWVGIALASPGTYYVSPSGNDSNPGTEALPVRTIARAETLAVSGDTIHLKAGTWNEGLHPKSGLAYVSEGAVVTGEFSMVDRSNISVQGIIFDPNYANSWGVLIRVSNVSFTDCVLRRASSNDHGVFAQNADHVTFRNCDIGPAGQDPLGASSTQDAFKMEYCSYWLIDNCAFTQGGRHAYIGMDLSCNHNVIQNCYFTNPWYRETTCQWNAYSNVWQFNDFGPSWNKGGGPGTASQIVSSYGIWRYNTAQDNEGGAFDMQTFDTGSNQCHDNRFYNNSFLGSGEAAVKNYWYVSGGHNNNQFLNNDFRKAQAVQIKTWNGMGFENSWFKNNAFRVGATINGPALQSVAWYQANYPANFSGNYVTDGSLVDLGRAPTTVTGGSGTSLQVADASWFTDGFGLVPADALQIGTGAPVLIQSISGNTITLVETRSWSVGDPVYLYAASGQRVLYGNAPDIGAAESQESGPTPTPGTPTPTRTPTATPTATATPTPIVPTPTATATPAFEQRIRMRLEFTKINGEWVLTLSDIWEAP